MDFRCTVRNPSCCLDINIGVIKTGTKWDPPYPVVFFSFWKCYWLVTDETYISLQRKSLRFFMTFLNLQIVTIFALNLIFYVNNACLSIFISRSFSTKLHIKIKNNRINARDLRF